MRIYQRQEHIDLYIVVLGFLV